MGSTKNTSSLEIPQLTGLFDPVPYKSPNNNNEPDLLDMLLEKKWNKMGRTAIKDSYGKVIGYSEKDPYEKNKINVFTVLGKKTGSYLIESAPKKSQTPERITLDNGNYKEKDKYRDDIWNVYNGQNQKIGYYQWSNFTQKWEYWDINK
jgi:hypothetical protein